jgi:VanZ family protein
MQYRALTTLLLVAYAIALAITTHLPQVQADELFPRTSDKTLHCLAYGLLGGLAAGRLVAHQRRERGIWAGWFVALLLAGGVDELTQPSVGRIADWGDWFADGAGVVMGMALVVVIDRLGTMTGANPPAAE